MIVYTYNMLHLRQSCAYEACMTVEKGDTRRRSYSCARMEACATGKSGAIYMEKELQLK